MDTQSIIDELIEIQGVGGVSIMAKDGVVIYSNNFLETDNTLVGFIGTAINDATTKFTLGNAKRSIIRGPGYKILIIIGDDHFFGVITDDKADEDIIEQKMEKIISSIV
jgi:predicted regulator of Ras-like GTPase activity (Roadblock/LC7/MglB family)